MPTELNNNPLIQRIVNREYYRNPLSWPGRAVSGVAGGMATGAEYAGRGVASAWSGSNKLSRGMLNATTMKYGLGFGFGALGIAFGEEPTAAVATGLGFAGMQAVADVSGAAGTAARKGFLQPVGRRVSNLGRKMHGLSLISSKAGAKAVASRQAAKFAGSTAIGAGLRGAGGGMRLAGAVASKMWGPLMVGAIAGSLLPEGNPAREAADYIFGLKSGEWISEQVESLSIQKEGGFGMNKPPQSQAMMRSREIAKMLLGQSTTASLLGREAEMMHN